MTATTHTPFDFDAKEEKTKWLVDGLYPLGQLLFNYAQAGIGKSLLGEALAVSIVYGQNFLTKQTMTGDVLIIDQDSPESEVKSRLKRFARFLNYERKHNLYLESMKGYTLDDGSLIKIINDYPSVILVLIDSLHSVCGKLNPNTPDMAVLATFKQKCLTGKKSIMINHHMSEKFGEYNGETSNPRQASMGYSGINQQADTYYILTSPYKKEENSLLSMLNVVPCSKRIGIPQGKFTARLEDDIDGNGEKTLNFCFGKYIVPYTKCEEACLSLFTDNPVYGFTRTVKEAYDDLQGLHSIQAVREALNSLALRGDLEQLSEIHNRFKYRLPADSPKQPTLPTPIGDIPINMTSEEYDKL